MFDRTLLSDVYCDSSTTMGKTNYWLRVTEKTTGPSVREQSKNDTSSIKKQVNRIQKR